MTKYFSIRLFIYKISFKKPLLSSEALLRASLFLLIFLLIFRPYLSRLFAVVLRVGTLFRRSFLYTSRARAASRSWHIPRAHAFCGVPWGSNPPAQRNIELIAVRKCKSCLAKHILGLLKRKLQCYREGNGGKRHVSLSYFPFANTQAHRGAWRSHAHRNDREGARRRDIRLSCGRSFLRVRGNFPR